MKQVYEKYIAYFQYQIDFNLAMEQKLKYELKKCKPEQKERIYDMLDSLIGEQVFLEHWIERFTEIKERIEQNENH